MSSDMECTRCPGKCAQKFHVCMPHMFALKRKKPGNIYEEPETRMNEALGHIDIYIQECLKRIKECLSTLKEIALKPDCLTSSEIDILVASEKQQGNAGWRERVENLQQTKRRSVLIEKVQYGELLAELKDRY